MTFSHLLAEAGRRIYKQPRPVAATVIGSSICLLRPWDSSTKCHSKTWLWARDPESQADITITLLEKEGEHRGSERERENKILFLLTLSVSLPTEISKHMNRCKAEEDNPPKQRMKHNSCEMRLNSWNSLKD